ncbi:WD40 repeat [Trypanosoma melophagium]|uniref:WD40 repeat n=1 Tax=Trypanosoma melophagium TaxID=715481 RepID=UPI00351A3260|nr:WD40 repeat [Trypanosoma melophagium]
MQLSPTTNSSDKKSTDSNNERPLDLPFEAPSLLRVDPVVVLEGHGDRVWCVSWCPSANVLASCSGDGTVKFWSCSRRAEMDENEEDSLTWKCIHTLKGEHSRTIRHVAWSPSGGWIACASFDRTATVWKRSDDNPEGFEFELEAVLDGHESEVKCVSWSTDDTLATCSRDRTVWIWDRVDVGEFECAGVLTGHVQDVKACAWITPKEGGDKKPILLSCSYDNTIKVWTESHRRDDWYCFQTLTRHEGTVWSIAVQPVEESIEELCTAVSKEHNFQPLICCCSDDGIVTFWARNSEGKFHVLCTATGFAERSLYSVCWAPSKSGAFVACASGDNKVTVLGLYHSRSDKEVHVDVVASVPCAHEADVNSVSFCPLVKKTVNEHGEEEDSFLLASGGDDNMVRLWRVKKV